MSIRVAGIGLSHWHSLYDFAYLRHLSKMDDVQLVGFHDDDPVTVEHRAGEIGGNIPTFTDYQRMLSQVKPDFVLALGRHDTMARVGLDLLDRRIPYVMEKPMSYSARQLRGVVEKAEATGGFAAAPLAMRYHPIIVTAKKFIEEGTYGPMIGFSSRMNSGTSSRYPAWRCPWMLDPAAANGGCLRNLGSHGLDAFVQLTGEGEDIEVTGAQLSWSGRGQPVEDYASVLLRTKKGVLGTVETGSGFPRTGRDWAWMVAFRDAILTYSHGVLKLNNADGEEDLPSWSPDDGPNTILRETMAAAGRGDRPPVTIRECYQAVRLIDLAYIAAGNPYGTAEV
jgi:predicted dehydrogenase